MIKVILAFLILLNACSAHSPFILKTTTDLSAPGAKTFPPHSNKIYVVKTSLPPSIQFDEINRIDVGKIWYGNADNSIKDMADKARMLGADAIIEVRTWLQPSGFAWAAPHGSCKAIKFKDKRKVDLSSFIHSEM
jgi:hypothetical protein